MSADQASRPAPALPPEPAGSPRPPRDRPAARPRRSPLRARLRRDWPLLAMVAPGAVVLLLFHYLPVLGNIVAFQDYNPYLGDDALQALTSSPFVGLDNFRDLFADPAFWDALWNTLSITAFQLVFFFPLPIALSILLNSILSR